MNHNKAFKLNNISTSEFYRVRKAASEELSGNISNLAAGKVCMCDRHMESAI